jgi:hypothetical protein
LSDNLPPGISMTQATGEDRGPPLCMKCKHYQRVEDRFSPNDPGHMCTRRLPNVVDGQHEYWMGPLCRDARYTGACGVDGRYWEPAS